MYIILNSYVQNNFYKKISSTFVLSKIIDKHKILICYINIILFRYLKICQTISTSTTVFNFVLKSIIINTSH